MAEIDNLRDEVIKLKERNDKLNEAVKVAQEMIQELDKHSDINSISHIVKPFSTNVINFSKNKTAYYVNNYGNVIPNGTLCTSNIVALSPIKTDGQSYFFEIFLRTPIGKFNEITVKFTLDKAELRTMEDCLKRTQQEYDGILAML